jgi:hypothetical protein
VLEILVAVVRGLVSGAFLFVVVGILAYGQGLAFWGPLGVPEVVNEIGALALAAIAGGFGFWSGLNDDIGPIAG